MAREWSGAAGPSRNCGPDAPVTGGRPGPSASPLRVRMRGARAGLILVAVFLVSAVALGGEKGWFGLTVSAEAEGLSLNPTLRSITVQKVSASSPAAVAGMAPGDTVVEIEGIAVAGAKANLLKATMQKSVGETLHLKIKRAVGELREISMVAVPKPAGQ